MTVFQAAADTPLTKQERSGSVCLLTLNYPSLTGSSSAPLRKPELPSLPCPSTPGHPDLQPHGALSTLGHGNSSCLWAFTLPPHSKNLPLYCSESSYLCFSAKVSPGSQCLSLLCTQSTELVLPSVLLRPSQ